MDLTEQWRGFNCILTTGAEGSSNRAKLPRGRFYRTPGTAALGRDSNSGVCGRRIPALEGEQPNDLDDVSLPVIKSVYL